MECNIYFLLLLIISISKFSIRCHPRFFRRCCFSRAAWCWYGNLCLCRKIFSLWMGCRDGTNTRAELLVLWVDFFGLEKRADDQDCLLRLQGCYRLGTNKSFLRVDNLDQWCARDSELKDEFSNLSFVFFSYLQEV